MSYHTEQRVETQRQQIRSGEGPGSSAPDREYERDNNSKARRLRPTDSTVSAGWRAEMDAVPGVEPEGWRDE